jgi:hypothetical protein
MCILITRTLDFLLFEEAWFICITIKRYAMYYFSLVLVDIDVCMWTHVSANKGRASFHVTPILHSSSPLCINRKWFHPINVLVHYNSNLNTTRNTAIGCALSEAVLREPHLKHYQQRFISSCPFQLLGVELSAVVHHEESLLIILWIISSSFGYQPLPII